MSELEQQLDIVQKNQNERIMNTKQQLALIRERKQKVKDEMDEQTQEQQSCKQYIMQNLSTLQRIGRTQEDVDEFNALIRDFVAVSGENEHDLIEQIRTQSILQQSQ